MRSSNVTGFDPARRGYHAVYRENEINHCPGCGRTHWYVGRTLAECGFCATALPLSESFGQPAGGGGHHPLAAAQPFGLRGLAARLWRAPDERGGCAPTV